MIRLYLAYVSGFNAANGANGEQSKKLDFLI